MGMFELAPVGIPIAIAGLAYMLTIGMRLMPRHNHDAAPGAEVGNRLYQADLVVPDGSPLIGKIIADTPIAASSDFTIVNLLRDGKSLSASVGSAILEAGD